MKKLESFLTIVVLFIFVAACEKKSSIKEILKDKVQRSAIIREISRDREISNSFISQLLKNNRTKKQIADNPIMRMFMDDEEYHADCPSGKYTKHFPDGTLKEIGSFRRYKFYDSLQRFHSNGSIEYASNYNAQGNEHGYVKYYYPNGQEEFVYQSNNGIPFGEATRYLEDGTIKETILYSSDGMIKRLIRHKK